jgi:hypothetical protein
VSNYEIPSGSPLLVCQDVKEKTMGRGSLCETATNGAMPPLSIAVQGGKGTDHVLRWWALGLWQLRAHPQPTDVMTTLKGH